MAIEQGGNMFGIVHGISLGEAMGQIVAENKREFRRLQGDYNAYLYNAGDNPKSFNEFLEHQKKLQDKKQKLDTEQFKQFQRIFKL